MLLVEYGDASIELLPCDVIDANERFSLDFVLVNSPIYRNGHDRNVNYFNQSFINAKVETRELDCVVASNIQTFHP